MHNYLPVQVICHASYTVSLCRPNNDPLYSVSMGQLTYLSRVCESIGIEHIVTHIGGVALGSTVQQGIQAIKQFCLAWLRQTRDHHTVLCLETDPGSKTGRKIGTLTVLYKIVQEINNPRIRLCFDTEHVYASGYDLSDSKLNQLALEASGVIHLNSVPSYVELGSYLDRHSKDYLRESKQLTYLREIYYLGSEKGIPMILERDKDYYPDDLEFIREEW